MNCTKMGCLGVMTAVMGLVGAGISFSIVSQELGPEYFTSMQRAVAGYYALASLLAVPAGLLLLLGVVNVSTFVTMTRC